MNGIEQCYLVPSLLVALQPPAKQKFSYNLIYCGGIYLIYLMYPLAPARDFYVVMYPCEIATSSRCRSFPCCITQAGKKGSFAFPTCQNHNSGIKLEWRSF